MDITFKIKAWLTYQLKAHYRMGHHVHSPYTYKLFTNVLFERWPYYSFSKIEGIRRRVVREGKAKKTDRQKYTQLLQRLCATNDAKTIIEIGRSDGISTMYLSANDSKSMVYSISDSKPTAIFAQTGYKNIQQKRSCELQQTLNQIQTIDMLYVRRSCGYDDIAMIFDKCRPKSRDGSIFVFDDIHADRQTEERWEEILRSEEITLSIDLFRMGIVWFRKELKRQHYTVKY